MTGSEAAALLEELRAQARERAAHPDRGRALYEQAIAAYPPPSGVSFSRWHALWAGSPLMVQAGEAELLLGDARNLAERAIDQGVEVTLDLWPGMFNWQLFAARLPEGREAVERAAGFAAERLSH